MDSWAETIVISLCENYLKEGRTIVTGNFYTYVPLAEKCYHKIRTSSELYEKTGYFYQKLFSRKIIKEFVGLEK